RANKLTLGGCGHLSKTDAIEDAQVQYFKDLRRDEVVDKSGDVALTWCSRFMRRHQLTVLRVTRSGRKAIEELEEE
ncbi:TPA: hypothetical protein N0F65_006830, partial [Lagenidium giganteum]